MAIDRIARRREVGRCRPEASEGGPPLLSPADDPLLDGRTAYLTCIEFGLGDLVWLQSWMPPPWMDAINADTRASINYQDTDVSGSDLQVVKGGWEPYIDYSGPPFTVKSPEEWLMLLRKRKGLPSIVEGVAPFPPGAYYAQNVVQLPSGDLVWSEFVGGKVVLRLLGRKNLKQKAIGEIEITNAKGSIDVSVPPLVLSQGAYVAAGKAKPVPNAKNGVAYMREGKLNPIRLVATH